MSNFYIERKTNTKWRKIGDTFEPIGPWRINRKPVDVLNGGYFSGPYRKK